MTREEAAAWVEILENSFEGTVTTFLKESAADLYETLRSPYDPERIEGYSYRGRHYDSLGQLAAAMVQESEPRLMEWLAEERDDLTSDAPDEYLTQEYDMLPTFQFWESATRPQIDLYYQLADLASADEAIKRYILRAGIVNKIYRCARMCRIRLQAYQQAARGPIRKETR